MDSDKSPAARDVHERISPVQGEMVTSQVTSQAPSGVPILFAEFNDAYSFRNLIEYLKNTNIAGNFVFSPENITYSRSDAGNTILNEIVISKSDLTYYVYNAPVPEVIIGITISNLRKITKPIGKKDSIRLYMLPNDPLLYIQIVSINTKALSRNNANFVRPQGNIERLLYDVTGYVRGDDNPNCTIPIMDFCRMCTAMNSISCSFVTIRGLSRGAIFEAMTDGSISGRIDKFGIIDEAPSSSSKYPSGSSDLSLIDSFLSNLQIREDKIKVSNVKAPKLVIQPPIDTTETRIKVRISTIKALSKINNLSPPTGTIKLYMEPDLPLKLICKIGTYGTLTIYLRDIDS